MKNFAAVMPVRNCLKYTKLATASLFQTTNSPSQLYLLDNGSTDGTKEWALGYRTPDDVSYIDLEQNLGVAKAWNIGIRLALEGEFERVLVINNDVVLDIDTINALQYWMDVYEDQALITCHSVAGAPEWMHDIRRHPIVEPKESEFVAFMITPSIIDRVGWFDEQFSPAYFEDRDYMMRMDEASVFHGRAMDAVLCHFHSRTMHEGNTPGLDRAFLANRDRFVAKWRHKLERLP